MEYESDQRHADLIIQQAGIGDCKAVSTPNCTDAEYEETKRLERGALQTNEAIDYRSIAARFNFLARDRLDVQYVAEDIAKHMAKPMVLDCVKIRRVARYMVGAPSNVHKYEWQQQGTSIDAYADSDWAGDRVSRKSTSGSALMIGGHVIKSWSTTQPVIALSSGEAGLHSLAKAASQAKGL